jgi:predicted GNAT family acetyltransferase
VAEPEVQVVDNGDARRYEARLVDRVVGFTDYRRKPGLIVFTHTEVDPALEGQGIGSRLAAGALDDARRQGLRVVAICPYIAAFIKRHSAYADLLAPDPARRHGR